MTHYIMAVILARSLTLRCKQMHLASSLGHYPALQHGSEELLKLTSYTCQHFTNIQQYKSDRVISANITLPTCVTPRGVPLPSRPHPHTPYPLSAYTNACDPQAARATVLFVSWW